jgi:hypothetical protein
LYSATAKTVRTFLIAQTLDFIASSLFAQDDFDRTGSERYSSIAPLDSGVIVAKNRKNAKNYHQKTREKPRATAMRRKAAATSVAVERSQLESQ